MASRFVTPVPQLFDDDGNPLENGTLTFYEPATNTPRAVYTDESASVPAANPITLNARGEPTTDVYLSGSYKVVAKRADGTTAWTRDDHRQLVDATALANASSATKGAGMVGFASALAYAVGTVGEYLRRIVVSAAGTVTQPRYVANNTDDSDTPDAAFRVARTLSTNAHSGHGFRDETAFAQAGYAYCAYDAAQSGSGNLDHLIGYQSRATYSGGGTLTNYYGYGAFPLVTGGSVTNLYGAYIRGDWSGAGAVTNNYGLYIENITKGTNKWSVYVANSAAPVYIAAPTQIAQRFAVGGAAQLVLGGTSTSAYPGMHYNYDPTTNTYLAADAASGWQWSSTRHSFRGAAAGAAGATPSFTDLVHIHTQNNANLGALYPGTNGTQNLGVAGLGWKEVFASNGTINTSDARAKTAVRPLTAAEIAAARDLAREIGAFQFLAAVAEKGPAARQHIGMTVQRAIEIMGAHGLDAFAYGFVCYDAWPADESRDAGDTYGFRTDQLALFIARGFEARLSALEGGVIAA